MPAAWRRQSGWTVLADWEARFRLVARVSRRVRGDMKTGARFEKGLRALGFNDRNWAGGQQVHGTRLRRVGEPTAPGEHSATDGLWTDRPGLALRVFTADCVPVFLCDPAGRRVALIHAGWRGTADGILTRALESFKKSWKTPPRTWAFAVGPHIGACCYEVGDDVARRFERVPGALRRRAGRSPMLSLAAALTWEARRAGLRQFTPAPDCTVCGRDYFSYRRNKTAARQAAVLALREDADE